MPSDRLNDQGGNYSRQWHGFYLRHTALPLLAMPRVHHQSVDESDTGQDNPVVNGSVNAQTALSHPHNWYPVTIILWSQIILHVQSGFGVVHSRPEFHSGKRLRYQSIGSLHQSHVRLPVHTLRGRSSWKTPKPARGISISLFNRTVFIAISHHVHAGHRLKNNY